MKKIEHKFVDVIPDSIEPGILYISTKYKTAIHMCPCGCRNEIVTPLSPTDWKLIYNGVVSLDPSVGNWSLECQSHYWITKDNIVWAPKWTRKQIEQGRKKEEKDKEAYYGKRAYRFSFFDFFSKFKEK